MMELQGKGGKILRARELAMKISGINNLRRVASGRDGCFAGAGTRPEFCDADVERHDIAVAVRLDRKSCPGFQEGQFLTVTYFASNSQVLYL